jgi:hypothetical protein
LIIIKNKENKKGIVLVEEADNALATFINITTRDFKL